VGGSPAGSAPGGQFIVAGDAICRAYRRQVAPLGRATTLAAQEQVSRSLVNAARQAVGQLEALSPPAPRQPTFKRFTGMTSAAIDEFAVAQSRSTSTQEATAVAVRAQDLAAYQTAVGDAQAADAAARQLGFHVCGTSGSDWL
jgi:hypothetical protein